MTDAGIRPDHFVKRTPNTHTSIQQQTNKPVKVENIFVRHANQTRHANAILPLEPETPKMLYFGHLKYTSKKVADHRIATVIHSRV